MHFEEKKVHGARKNGERAIKQQLQARARVNNYMREGKREILSIGIIDREIVDKFGIFSYRSSLNV